MAESGYIKIARKAYRAHPFWKEKRVFSKWEAWEWMIQSAAFGDHERMVSSHMVELRRGEFVASIRYLADAWGWSVKKVRVYLDLVSRMDQIRAQRETQVGTVYALVNYDTYQGGDDDEGTPKGTPRAQEGHTEGTPRAQKRNRNKAGKEGKDSPPWFDEAWAIYPKRLGGNSRADAERAWRAAMKKGADPKDMLAGTRRYRDFAEATGKIGTEFVKQGATFYGKGEHWAEEYDIPADAGASNGNHTGPVIEVTEEQYLAWSQPR